MQLGNTLIKRTSLTGMAFIAPLFLGLVMPTALAQNICTCEPNMYVCQDFDSVKTAQACFEHCQKQSQADVHQLDADKNGKACDS